MADSVVIRIKGEDSGFKEALSSAASTAKSFGSTASKALAGVTKATAALSAAAAAAGVSCLQVGMQFEAAMSQVQAISGASAADMERLTQVAKDYGASTSFSATEAANALNYMALAGWNTQQSIDALGGVLNLAAASGMDLATASDMVTDYLSAFGMAASDATYMADLMAFAQSKSNTSAQALGDAYGNCAASMHAAGQDIETTTAALMVLANQGLKGSEAGTAMSAVMRDLTDKMENGKVMIGNTAVAVQDAQGNFRDLNDIMADVAAATAGMGTAEASAALMTTFTARSVKAVQMLMAGGIDAVNEYEDALRGAEGTAAEQSEIMLDNLQGDITIFKSALEGLQISASEAMSGTARELVQAGTELMNALNEGAKKGGIEGIANAFIDQIPTLVDKAVGMISQLMSGVAKKLPALIKKLVGTLPEMLSGALTLAPELVDALFEGATALVEGLVSRLPELVPTLITGISKLLSSALSGVLHLGTSLVNSFAELISDALLGDDAQDAWDSISTDKEYEAQLKVGLNTEVDTSGAEGSVETAYENVRKLLRGPLLTEAQRQEILSMIGDDYQAVYDKLIEFGLPPEQAEALAGKVTSAGVTVTSKLTLAGLTEAQQSVVLGRINDGYTAVYNALVGFGVPETQAAELAAEVIETGKKVARDMNDNLGLSTEQIEIISGKIDDGYQAVYDTLVGFGIPAGTASTAAQSLIDFGKEFKAKCAELDLSVPWTTIAAWALQAKGNRTKFIAQLQASGQFSQDEIESITQVFDDTTEQITGNLPNVVSEIYKTLTDGNLENDDPEALKKKVQEALEAEYAAIDEWLDNEIAKLDSTSAGYDTQVAALTEQAESYKTTVTELAAGMDTLIDECAYAESDVVKQRMTEFAEIEARAQGVIDMLDEVEGRRAETVNTHWSLVTSGATTNAENIGIAQAYSRSTYDQQIAQIQQTAEELRAQAEDAWLNGWVNEGEAGKAKYSTAEQEINEWVKAATAQALAAYQTRGSQLMQGVIGAFSSLTGMSGLENVGMLSSAAEELMRMSEIMSQTDVNWDSAEGQAMIQYVKDLGISLGLLTQYDADQLNGETLAGTMSLLYNTISGEGGLLATAISELESNPEGLSKFKTVVTGLIEAGVIEGVSAADVEDMGIDQLLGLILNGGEGVEVEPEVDLTPPTITGLPDVTETVSEATQGAAESGGSAVEAQPEVSVTPTVTVEEVETSGSSGLQKDVEKELSSQKMKVNVSADVTLKVSVSDSNGAEVGRAAGEEIGEAIGEGIEAKDSAAQTAGSGLASSAKTGARSGRSAMRTAGVYVGEGFNAGLRSKKSDILRTAEEIANAVSAKLREAFQINSPSHVTERIGESVGEGLDLGMRESIGAAIRNAENIVGMMDLRVRDPMAGVTESLSGAADRLAEASSRSMAVYLNGRQVGRALERDIPAVVNNNTRHINLGVGKA